MRFPLAFVVIGIALAGCTSQPLERSSERLLVQVPNAWERVYQFNNNKTRLSEFVPPEQTAGQWDTKLSIESHGSLVDTDPIEILMAEIKRLQENCSFVQHFNLFSGIENGYPTSVRLALCGENEPVEQGEVSLMKAIQANDYLYVLRLNRRIPPFEASSPEIEAAEVGVWSDYMSRIRVCDPTTEAHPCPAND